MRPAVLALVASGLAAAACSSPSAPSCPGDVVAAFQLTGTLALAADLDPAIADPAQGLPDCTAATAAPVPYPPPVAFDAKLSEGPDPSATALCRSNGTVYAGERTDPWHVSVSAEADPAILCNDACAADFRVAIEGDVATDAGGAPATLDGIVVEILTPSRGACECVPVVPGADPPARACAFRYALSGVAR